MSPPLWEIKLQVPQGAFQLALDIKSDARVLGIFGPSGSGKTTLIETVAGLRKQATGLLRCGAHTWLHSEQGTHHTAETRNIGYVPQDLLLFPHLNARQNLQFGQQRSQGQASIFDEVIEVLELEHLLEHRIEQLSGGQKQRIALGRALCSAPQLLILDEPLAALDAELRHRILPFLLRVRAHFNSPILIVSHNPFELQALCDEVIALRDGQVVCQGRPIEVFTHSEIYTTLAAEGFQNVLPARVLTHATHHTQVALDATHTLNLLHQPNPVGDDVLVSIPARDILIATQVVSGLSARNCLPAQIESLTTLKNQVALKVRLAGSELPAWVIELTPDAVESLHLCAKQPIYLIIKSSSISVY